MTKEQKSLSASLTQEEKEPRKHNQINEQEVHAKLQKEVENFFYPGTTVLKNKYRMRDEKELTDVCSRDAEKMMAELRGASLPEQLNSFYLKELHKQMFSKAFEWAGHTRDESFPLQDGSVVSMAFLKKKEYKKPFASGIDIQKGLQKLDEMLLTKEELQSLTREEFVTHATQVMAHLQYLNPFREGNRRTAQIFMEKLGQAAGHELDFSLVTRKRKDFVRAEIMNDDNKEPLRYLLDDISHPEKLLVLNEFTNSMRALGLNENNYHLAVVAQEGQTYQGIYRGSGPDGFMMDVKGAYILGHKKYLTPEQVKTLKIGDPLSFTAPFAQEAQKVLLPKENVPDLSNEELAQRVYESALVKNDIKKIEILCQVIYGEKHALQNILSKFKVPITHEDLKKGEKLARRIGKRPQSVCKLRGVSVFGIKSGARQHAEENFLPLSCAISQYVHTLKQAEKNTLESHSAEQQRCAKSVEMPSKQIKNLFFMSKEKRQEILSSSPELRREVENYSQRLNERLSSSEYRIIENRHYARLAQVIGTSVNHAGEIAVVARQTREIYDIIIQQKHREMNIQRKRDLSKSLTKTDSEKFSKISATKMKGKKIRQCYARSMTL